MPRSFENSLMQPPGRRNAVLQYADTSDGPCPGLERKADAAGDKSMGTVEQAGDKIEEATE